MKNIFTDGWELRCETQFLTEDRERRKVYICSPLRAQDRKGVLRNMRNAKAYMHYAFGAMKCLAYAPHAFLPAFLDDEIEDDRKFALALGYRILKKCQSIFVCGNKISQGMEGEIAEAAKQGIVIRGFESSLMQNVKRIVADATGDVKKIVLDQSHPPMASENPITSHIRFINDLTQ